MKNGIKITRYNSKNDDYTNKNFAYSTLAEIPHHAENWIYFKSLRDNNEENR